MNPFDLSASLFSRGSYSAGKRTSRDRSDLGEVLARNLTVALLTAIYCTSSEVVREARVRPTSGLMGGKRGP